MSVAGSEKNWSAANQRYLVAEFARLKLRLGAEGDGQAMTADLDKARAALPGPAAVDTLAELFGLSVFERDLLLLAAGVEMDAELARLCAAAQGQAQRPHATFGVALAALENSHWSALAALAPLRRWRLLEVDDSAGLVAGKLRIDERVLHYLAGVNYLDPRLQPLLHSVASGPVMAKGHRQIANAALDRLRENSAPHPVVILSGDDADGQSD